MPTRITGEDESRIDIFEGFWDYLTWLQMNKRKAPKHTTYVMNSVSFQERILDEILNNKNRIRSIFLFLNNDSAGLKVTTNIISFFEQQNINIGTMNEHYLGFNDLSEKWMQVQNNKLTK